MPLWVQAVPAGTQSGESLGPLQAAIVIPPEEEAMGREFIAAARQQLAFIEDPLLVRYVEIYHWTPAVWKMAS